MTKPKLRQSAERAVPIFEKADVEKNKVIAGLAYLLFFLPLIACPDSPFGRFHANQALLLWILGAGGSFILTTIPAICWSLLPFFGILVLILAISGLLNGMNGKAKELPLIGKLRILQ